MKKEKYQKTIREHYEQLYANNFDNLEEMDNFLETYSPPKLNQEEIDQLNRPIIKNEIECVIKTLPTNESPGQNAFTGKFLYPSVFDFCFLVFLFLFFCLFRATPVAYGGSQARGLIGAVASGLCQDHSSVGSSCVCDPQHSSRQCQIFNPLSEARDHTCLLMDTSLVCYC